MPEFPNGDQPLVPDDEAVWEPEPTSAVAELLEHLWRVILYNDDWHTFDEVIFQLQKATGCATEKAARIAHEVHTRGKAIAFTGEKEQCRHVAAILREIRLQVELDEA